jgi:hypothetical protein
MRPFVEEIIDRVICENCADYVFVWNRIKIVALLAERYRKIPNYGNQEDDIENFLLANYGSNSNFSLAKGEPNVNASLAKGSIWVARGRHYLLQRFVPGTRKHL